MHHHFKQTKLFTVLWMFVVLSFLGFGIVYFLDNQEQKNQSPKAGITKTIPVTIAAKPLAVPQSWLGETTDPQTAARASLQLQIPVKLAGENQNLTATLLSSAKAAPSAYLLDTLYIHKFDDAPARQIHGLVVKNMEKKDGFADESIWYDALDTSPFVAKCLTEEIGDTKKLNCVTTMLVNKRVTALIQFDGHLLPEWREIHRQLRQLLPALNAN